MQIVDISHGIDSQDILEAAFVISTSYRFFPEGTIHLIIVDPGVGGRRRPILVKASGHYFMGPDNGALSWVIDADPTARVIEVTAEEYFLKNVSAIPIGKSKKYEFHTTLRIIGCQGSFLEIFSFFCGARVISDGHG